MISTKKIFIAPTRERAGRLKFLLIHNRISVFARCLWLYPILLVFISIPYRNSAVAQETTAWDNTLAKNWPARFSRVEIPSSFDGEIQAAIFYKSQLATPQPLIVSLHTWSGNYLQEDPLAKEILLRGWNYIHPDFRGPNNRPEACGSEKVLSDIEDAIAFAIKQGNVDTDEVHIIGVSGGGYATLMAFMNLDYPVKSFSSWVGISKLEDWYWECVGRGLKYAHDLEGVTTGGNGFDASVARERSPVHMPFPTEKRANSSLFIYAGIHDGYSGSVPVTQSINMFNYLVKQGYPENVDQLVSDSLKLVLLEKRLNPKPDSLLSMGGRKIHLLREIPKIHLTLFEGTHEMIVPNALALVPVHNHRSTVKLNILTVGDSNGAAQNGWPVQLAKLLPFSTIINHSISGNTIGFDNLGNPRLNTIRNMNTYLDSTCKTMSPGNELDHIIFCLGTNDAKKVFKDSMDVIPENLDSLLSLSVNYFKNHDRKIPKIVLVSPPPMNEKIANQEKYGGGNARIDINNLQFKKSAEKHHVIYLDVNSKFKAKKEAITVDGVHLNSKTQFEFAEAIVEILEPKSK